MKAKTTVLKAGLGAAVLLTSMTISGGAASQQTASNVTPAHNVRVYWSTPQEVEQLCGKGVAGCARLANVDKPYVEVWAKKPMGWDDYDGLCDLGNVVLYVVDSGSRRTTVALPSVGSSVVATAGHAPVR